jgi:hypothetical protein
MNATTTQRVLSGLDGANTVVLDDKGERQTHFVHRGEPLPVNLVDGEEERLERLGGFDRHTPGERNAAVAALRREVADRSQTASSPEDLEAMAAWAEQEKKRMIEEGLL